MTMVRPIQIFISYRHHPDDEKILDELKPYLDSALLNSGTKIWTDREIKVNNYWDDEIKSALYASDIGIVLVSQYYFSSKYINQVELASFIDRREKNEIALVPIILSPCMWEKHDWLSKIQFFPTGKETIETHYQDSGKRKELYKRISTRLYELIQEIRGREDYLPDIKAPPHTPKWLPVKGGMVHMGDQSLTNAPEYEKEVSHFYIAETPVTQEQYARFIKLTGHVVPKDDFFPEYSWQANTPPTDKKDHPVVLVSVADAEAYCQWLTEELQSDIDALNGKWRVMLPSELEWEWVARGAERRPYAWGDDLPTKLRCNYNGLFSGTTPVKQFTDKQKSPFGALDMTGNVWEWTRTVAGKNHILRGGCWHSSYREETLHTAYRHSAPPDTLDHIIGFRVVLVREI